MAFKMKGYPVQSTSAFKQKEEKLVLVRATTVVDSKTGKSHATEDMIGGSGPGAHIPVSKSEDGTYFVKTKDGDKVNISPNNKSVVPASLVKGVKVGSELQKVIREYNTSKGKE